MSKYVASFIGRQAGAIGVSHRVTTFVEGESPERARRNLYDGLATAGGTAWEHIDDLKLTDVDSGEEHRP